MSVELNSCPNYSVARVPQVGWLGALTGGPLCAMLGLFMVRSTDLDGTFPLWTAGEEPAGIPPLPV